MILTLLGIQTSEVSLLSSEFYLPCTLVYIVGVCCERFLKFVKMPLFQNEKLVKIRIMKAKFLKNLENNVLSFKQFHD